MFSQRCAQAYLIDNRNLEALIVKGAGLMEMKRYQESIMHYREAVRMAPHRYEAHKGLIDAYLAFDRVRNAISVAGQAYKQLGTNARSLTVSCFFCCICDYRLDP